jgi:PIN domain
VRAVWWPCSAVPVLASVGRKSAAHSAVSPLLRLCNFRCVRASASAWLLPFSDTPPLTMKRLQWRRNALRFSALHLLRLLPITMREAERAGNLPGPHRDPIDRTLIAQATLADLVLVSNEAMFDRYGVRRFW